MKSLRFDKQNRDGSFFVGPPSARGLFSHVAQGILLNPPIPPRKRLDRTDRQSFSSFAEINGIEDGYGCGDGCGGGDYGRDADEQECIPRGSSTCVRVLLGNTCFLARRGEGTSLCEWLYTAYGEKNNLLLCFNLPGVSMLYCGRRGSSSFI